MPKPGTKRKPSDKAGNKRERAGNRRPLNSPSNRTSSTTRRSTTR